MPKKRRSARDRYAFVVYDNRTFAGSAKNTRDLNAVGVKVIDVQDFLASVVVDP